MSNSGRRVFRRDRDGFRLRGEDMTRIETFTDAAFAFAVSLLVIAGDSVPTSFDGLSDALLGVPAFGLAFALIMTFWVGHWTWSRRYGLEDAQSILLSCLLVFLILVFVYPLKYVASLFTTFFSGGRLSTGVVVQAGQLHDIFAIYGIGYVAMTCLIIGLNLHALRLRDQLELDPIEVFLTRANIRAWSILAAVGTLSVVLALTLPVSPFVLPAWVYMLLPIIMPWNGRRAARRLEALRREHSPPDHP